ncbi:MAG: aspartate kinase [Parcubacteria group bacterium Gr01-1014_31]|nr:MAG: aspartate kinase [Parcubacteria group bacterium Gr01-1014_31]
MDSYGTTNQRLATLRVVPIVPWTIQMKGGHVASIVVPEGTVVAKFGGTSVATADQIKKVGSIMQANARREYLVVSAPGKRTRDDHKVTDLLYLCQAHVRQGIRFDHVFQLVRDRFREIVRGLQVGIDLEVLLDDAERGIIDRPQSPDFAASRGEFLMARILAAHFHRDFMDASSIIFFQENGQLDSERTYRALGSPDLSSTAVIPGFYGALPDGSIKTFSRGGSDITGAIVARGVGATLYENWTDVPGLLMADPKIVAHPRPIARVTYGELRELAYSGATVLHDEAIFPVREARIPVNIRDTNDPDAPGTLIVSETDPAGNGTPITGIAGRRDFTVLEIRKALMNNELGFGQRVLSTLAAAGISYEHTPTGIDTMSVVVATKQLGGKLPAVADALQQACRPDSINIFPDLALIAVVGRRMRDTPGIAGRLFGALGDASVNIRMIDQGASETTIIIGVENADYEVATRAIYQAFCA